MNSPSRTVVYIALSAALYAILTIALSPISYGPIQFRVSEAVKVLALFHPAFAVGMGVGTFFANLNSPFVGPWELVWMPLTDIAGGLLAYGIFRLFRQSFLGGVLGMTAYSLTTAVAVSIMLAMLGVGLFIELGIPILVSELILLLGGLSIFWPTRSTILGRVAA